MNSVLDLELRAVVRMLHRNDISATELLQEAMGAVEKYDHLTNAVIAISRDRALAEASQLDSLPHYQRGKLHGVPLAHKDMFYRQGEVSTLGSKQLLSNVQPSTASILRRLDEAGGVSFARLHMCQFAMGATGHNPDFGRCCNPFALDKITGGSSSGSAAAVAARFAYGALGSDTGGSLRLPAALCGVVSIKPTQYRVPSDGVMGLSESLDAAGPIARASGDVARLMDVILCQDIHEAAVNGPPEPIRIGIPTSYYCDELAPEIAKNYEAAISCFAKLGYEIVKVDVPDHSHFADLADTIWKPEAAALHLPTLQTSPTTIAEQARVRLMQGLATSAVDYIRARQLRSVKLTEMLDGPLTACEVILTPALRIPPPLAEDVAAIGGAVMRSNLETLTALTRPLNFLGLPGLVTPSGLDSSGAPLSIQLIGRPHSEPLLLQLGHRFEQATGFNKLKPQFLTSEDKRL